MKAGVLMAIGALALWGGAASGQDDPEGSAETSDADAPIMLDDIVVTATRREQLQRTVPLAITTLTGDKLREMGATRFDEYAPVVPGLSFTNCGCTPGEKYTFRGIATDGIKSSLRPLTAVYLDDTPITYANGISTIAYSADPDLVDIDRVEVIRGPQGTLFGASAMGGAIRIIPKAPVLGRNEGSLAMEALTITDGGNGYGTSAITNIPLLDGNAAVRGVGYYRSKAGFIDTAPLAEGDYNDDRTGGVRLAGRYEPDDTLRVDVRFAHHNRRGNGGPTELAYTDEPLRTQIYQREPNYDEWSLGSIAFDFAAGELRVFSTTSYLDRVPYHTRDFTPNVAALYGVDVVSMLQGSEAARELTQEFRLQAGLTDRLQWLGGMFFQEQDTGFVLDLLAPGFDAATGGDADAAGLPDNLLHFVNRATIRHYALFEDVTYRLSPAWEASAGVRVYRVEQDYATQALGLLSGTRDDAGATHESGATPRASLQFQPHPGLSLYASAAKGFRPGGVNYVSDACAQAQVAAGLTPPPAAYQSDSLWSYEFGAKTAWLDQRLHASGAVYHIEWDDIQTQRAVTPVCAPTDNSGRARTDGIELVLTALVLPRLEIELAEAYTDARFAEDSPATRRRKGDAIPDVPRNTFALAATYALPHPASFFRLDYQLRGSAPNDLGGLGNDTIEAYEQIHARLGWSFEKLRATFTVRNLTNERGAFSRVAFPGGPFEIRVPPRTVTLGLQYPF